MCKTFYICVEVKNIFNSVRMPFYKAHEQKADLNNNKKIYCQGRTL